MNWYALQGLSHRLLSGLADASLSALVLAASAAIVVLFLRRNAVAHHALWTGVLFGMLILPVLRLIIPAAYLHLPQPFAMDTVTIQADLPTVVETGAGPLSGPRHRTGHPAWLPGWPEYMAILYVAGVGLLGMRLVLGQQSGNYVWKLGRLGRIILLCGAAFLVWVSTTVDFQSVARAQEKAKGEHF